ncbi:MAG: DUF1804 family protein [Azonexus sp.]
MAHPPEKRQALRTAYIGGLPLEAAADKVEVPYATARNWFRAARDEGDDWDKFRAASLIVAGGGIEQAMGRIIAAGLMRCEALLERIGDITDPAEAADAVAALGDTISKLKNAAKSFMPDVSEQAVAIDTLKALSIWAGNFAAAKGMVLAEILDGYASVKKLQIAAPLEELRARARAAGAVDSTKVGGLSDESADAIRAKILGVG